MSATSVDKADVLATLRQVMDPELDLNIVDLGLIYDVAIEGAKVSVRMTVTTPGCPMQLALESGVCSALLALDAVEDVHVEMVFEPAWTPERIAPEVRADMGLV